jgi:hypothetical protein
MVKQTELSTGLMSEYIFYQKVNDVTLRQIY